MFSILSIVMLKYLWSFLETSTSAQRWRGLGKEDTKEFYAMTWEKNNNFQDTGAVNNDKLKGLVD